MDPQPNQVWEPGFGRAPNMPGFEERLPATAAGAYSQDGLYARLVEGPGVAILPVICRGPNAADTTIGKDIHRPVVGGTKIPSLALNEGTNIPGPTPRYCATILPWWTHR